MICFCVSSSFVKSRNPIVTLMYGGMKGKISDMAEFQHHAVIIISVVVGEGEIFADAMRWWDAKRADVYMIEDLSF